MATIVKRGDSWRAQVRIQGYPSRSASFPTKAQASAWAVATEAELRAIGRGEVPDKRVRDLLRRYSEEVSEKKRGGRWEQLRIEAICRVCEDGDELADVHLRRLSSSHIGEWRDRRLKVVSPATVLREWNLLSAAFNTAVKEWGWLRANPMRNVRRPDQPAPRTRRAVGDELDRIYLCLGYSHGTPPETKTARTGAAGAFAIETAMRAGEIVGLEWRHIDLGRRVAHLPMTKNGSARDVPLSSRAVEILLSLPSAKEKSGPVFDIDGEVLSTLWRKGAARACVSGLRFHDLRREALSRLAKKMDVMTLAKVSGHKDLRILLNTYYAVDMADVAACLD